MTLDEERALFLHQLGAAFGHWASVEFGVLLVVQSCVPPDQYEGLAKGMFSIENFRSRLKFANVLMDHRWGKTPHFATWELLAGRVEKSSSQRNALAHQVIVENPAPADGRRIASQPWVFKRPKRKGIGYQPPPGSLCLRDVTECGIRFNALAGELSNFADTLKGKPPRIPSEALTAGPVPTLAAISKRIRGAFGIAAR